MNASTTPADYYQQRIAELEQQLDRLSRRKSRLAWARLLVILLVIAALYFLWPVGIGYAVGAAALLLLGFVRVVFTDLDNKSAIQHTRHLVHICKDEQAVLNHQYLHLEDGLRFMPPVHDYAHDLDIFGRASLFQYISRTRSDAGGQTLAQWLLQPATPQEINRRQEAVKELAQQPGWRQQLQAYGTEKTITQSTHDRLEQWLQEEQQFLGQPVWRWLSLVVPAIVLGAIALNIADVISTPFRNYILLGAGLLAFYISKKVTPLHNKVSRMADELDIMSDCIRQIEDSTFNSPLLYDLQQVYRQEGKASAQLKQLKKILERMDLRYNPVVFIPLDILLQWDLQQALALEKWKKDNRNHINGWFAALGEFEALGSLGTLYFNNPEWNFPMLHSDHFYMEANGVGHPLINPAKRVNNDIHMHHSGELMLVTGSNMAGKSTYLRSIGVNVVLAMAGSPVCAKDLALSPVQLISSMRIADNLEESTSTFYAELKKLKAVIDKVNRGEKVFILLDEILRGTNSLDRHTGSAALIKQLIQHKAAAIIATHDVELAKLESTYPQQILNYHFDVQVEGEELFFDYRLKGGICTSLNASILMKKIGIEL
jgi:hypothetical protein